MQLAVSFCWQPYWETSRSERRNTAEKHPEVSGTSARNGGGNTELADFHSRASAETWQGVPSLFIKMAKVKSGLQCESNVLSLRGLLI